MEREKLLQTVERWQEEERYEDIVRLLEDANLQEEPELRELLAVAYNNLGEYERALAILWAIKQPADRRKNLYRQAYSLYFLNREEEAKEKLAEVLALDMEFEWALELLAVIEEQSVKRYTEDELHIVTEHIRQYIGAFEQVFQENFSRNIQRDIVIIEPTPECNYYILCTLGMGARPMPGTPAEYPELARAELLLILPADWRIGAEEEEWFWPIRWLKTLAGLPFEENTWLGRTHSVATEGPVASNSGFEGFILEYPFELSTGVFQCQLPNGELIQFYQMIPLYKDEMEYKVRHSAEALYECFGENFTSVVDIHRPCYLESLKSSQAMVLDSAQQHYDGSDFPPGLELAQSCTHMAYFLEFCALHHLLNEEILDQLRLYGGQDLRLFLLEERSGILRYDDLNIRGRAFALAYYREKTDFSRKYGTYMGDYAGYVMRAFQDGRAECLFGEKLAAAHAFFHLRYNEENKEKILTLLEQRYWEFEGFIQEEKLRLH